MGSFRRGDDPLDRMPARGGEDYRGEERSTGSQRDYDRARELDRRKKGDRDREERLANMDKPGARPAAPAGVPSLYVLETWYVDQSSSIPGLLRALSK
jgi:hypothetical protein